MSIMPILYALLALGALGALGYHLDRARLIGSPVDEANLLKVLEVRVNGGGGGQAYGTADLAH